LYLTSLLEVAWREYPEKVAVYGENMQLTYAELYNQSDRMANALQKLGVTRGDRVGIYLSSRPEFYICYWSIIRLGAVAVLLNPMYKEREIEHVLTDTGAKVCFTEESIVRRLQVVSKEIPEKLSIICLGNSADTLSFDSLLKDNDTRGIISEARLNDVVSIIYTSGTTGKPKGATHTHKSIWSNVSAFSINNKFTSGDVLLCCLPIFNNFGLNVVSMATFYIGGNMVLFDRFDAKKILSAMGRYKVTYMAGTPTMYVYLLQEYDVGDYHVNTLRVCNSGGANLPDEVIKKWEKRFKSPLINGYGQTEASGFSTLTPVVGVRKNGAVGLPISNIRVKIVNEAGEELSRGKVGEIALKGDPISEVGYWNNEEANKQAWQDGWFLSNDLGYIDEDGYLFIVDRKNDLIITGGSNIYPAELEEVLYQHPKVSLAAVVGVPDEVKGELAKAFIVLKEGADCTESELINYCRDKLAVYKAPRLVEFVNDMPRGVTGKILKRVLKEQVAASKDN